MDDFDLTQRGSLPTLFEANTDAVSADQLHVGLAVSAAISRSKSSARCAAAIATWRTAIWTRATGTIRSWWKWRSRPSWCAGSWRARSGRRADAEVDVHKVYGRRDFAIIGELIEPRTRVLDLGCGEGELLAWLKENKHVDGRGVEMDRRARAEGHRARRLGVSRRSGIRGGGLSGPGVRLRDPVADVAGDARSAAGAARDAARGPARDCGVPEFRALPVRLACAVERRARPRPSCSRTTGTIRRTFTSSRCWISKRWRRSRTGKWSGAFSWPGDRQVTCFRT